MANSDVDGGAPSGLSASDDRKGFVVLPRRWVVERTDGSHQRQAGADRLLRVVLMRLRVAEIDQHPVAQIFGDKAGEPRRRRRRER